MMTKRKQFIKCQILFLAIMATAFMHEATAGNSWVTGCIERTNFNTAFLSEGIQHYFSIKPKSGAKAVYFTLGKTKIKHGVYGGMAWNKLTPEDMTRYQPYLKVLLSAAETRRMVTVSWAKSGSKKNLVIGTKVYWKESCEN